MVELDLGSMNLPHGEHSKQQGCSCNMGNGAHGLKAEEDTGKVLWRQRQTVGWGPVWQPWSQPGGVFHQGKDRLGLAENRDSRT